MGLMSPLLAVLSILCGLALSMALFPLLTPWFLDRSLTVRVGSVLSLPVVALHPVLLPRLRPRSLIGPRKHMPRQWEPRVGRPQVRPYP